MNLPQLRRVRWAVRAVLILGVAASVAANILHARPNPVAQAIAAWPPLALLITIELISRVPMHRRSLAAARLVATTAIASIAAWVSYWHMAGVAARYGEQADAAHLIPFSVDGLVVVASVCLVELAGRIRTAETVPAPVELVVGVPVGVAPAAPGRGPDGARTEPPSTPALAPSRTNGPSNEPDGSLDGRSAKPAVASGRTADGRRQATLDDVRLAVAAGTPATRDALGKRLRADGLSAGNDAVGALLKEYRTDGRTADGGRVNGHPVTTGGRS